MNIKLSDTALIIMGCILTLFGILITCEWRMMVNGSVMVGVGLGIIIITVKPYVKNRRGKEW